MGSRLALRQMCACKTWLSEIAFRSVMVTLPVLWMAGCRKLIRDRWGRLI